MPVKPLLAFVCFLFSAQPGLAQETTLILRDREVTHAIFANITYMGSGDSITTIAQANKHFASGHFTANKNRDLNLGIAKDNYWVHFTLVSATAMDANVVLENPRLNEVDIYIARNDSMESLATLGDNFPYHNRIIDYNQFVFPVRLEPNQSVQVFLYLRHKGNTLQMPVLVMNYNSLISRAERGYLTAGISTGVFCITFFFG